MIIQRNGYVIKGPKIENNAIKIKSNCGVINRNIM